MDFSISVLDAVHFAADAFQLPAEKASESLAAKFAEVRGLKTFPVIAQQAISILSDPNSSIGELAGLIKKDPALASNVLRLANSAFFSRGKSIQSLEQAVVRLGQRSVSEIVGAVVTADMFPDVDGVGKIIRDHCAATAAIAKKIALEFAPRAQDGMFLIGLMHDVGKLLLIESGEHLYQTGEPGTVREPDQDHLSEMGTLGFDHGILGGQILWHWRLPEPAPNVVAWHHHPPLAYKETDIGLMVAILRIADHIELGLSRDLKDPAEFDEILISEPDLEFAKVQREDIFAKWGDFEQTRLDALSIFGF